MAIKRRKKSGVRWVGPAKLVAEAQSSSSDASSDYPDGSHYQSAQPQHKPYKVVSAKPAKKDPPKKNGKKKAPAKAQPLKPTQTKKA